MTTIFSIADLHLSDGDKPMDVFGAHWENHFERISADWRERVRPEDIVLLPGDLSWAMRLEEAAPQLAMIGELPGRKILLRGNHDYWWSAIGRVRAVLPEGMFALQNDALLLEDWVFCGTRGWILPGEDTPAADRRIYERELLRLEMSLKAAQALAEGRPIIAMLHYPPLTAAEPDSAPARLLSRYGVAHAVYGHLHGAALKTAFAGEHGGVVYHQVSCDGLGFRLARILPEN